MPQARTNKSESKSNSRAYLHQPIEFRKVLHLRTDHHSKVASECAPDSPIRRPAPSQSHLERLVDLQHRQAHPTQSRTAHRTISHSHTRHRSDLTPLQPPSPAQRDSSKRALPLEPQHQQAPVLRAAGQPGLVSQQKLAVKQEAEGGLAVELERIEREVTRLVNKKLQVMFESLHSRRQEQYESRKEQINGELQGLVQEIRQLRGRGSEMPLLNQKIALIETLMAEQSTEAQLMKKHYYRLSSSKLKGKVGDFNHLRTRVGDAYKSLVNHTGKHRKPKPAPQEAKKPLFQESTNKSAFKSPSKADYESYRYRQQAVPPNLQPLPRSSYKRDYLVLKSLPDEKIVNRDHSPYYPQHKTREGSVYGQDYKSIRAETINHRELDAFRNKIRTLKVSYMPKNRSEAFAPDRSHYYRDVQETAQSRLRSSPSRANANQRSEQELSCSKRTLLSESRREYAGELAYEPSRIKDRQLQSFQYKLKQLFKA